MNRKATENMIAKNIARAIRGNEKKMEQLTKLKDRCVYLTSSDGICITAELYEGNIARFVIEGTRSSMTVTVNTVKNEIVRKPRGAEPWYTVKMCNMNVYQIEEEIEKMESWKLSDSMIEAVEDGEDVYNDYMKEQEKKREMEANPFGLRACMESIEFDVEVLKRDPFEMLEKFEQRAKEDIFFNKTMIEAVKQYIEEKGLTQEEKKGAEDMTREERREAEREIRNMRHDVIEAYNGTETPTETIELLVTERGYEGACKAVATVVNMVSLHDGRIYDKTREWAQNVEGAYSNEVCRDLGFYGVDSWIHSAHVNQIGEAMKNYEPKTEPRTVDTCDLIHEIKSELGDDAPIDIGYICDYDKSAYVSDAFAEIADKCTSIYYSDIIKYISEHVEAVNDAIEEFGWDGCGSDLYNAGQMAEYLEINNWLWEHEEEAYKVYALDWYRFEYMEEVTKNTPIRIDTWERFCDELENYGQCDRLGDVIEIMKQTIEAMEESEAE